MLWAGVACSLALQPRASVVLMSGYSAAHFDLDWLPRHTQFLA
jgi:hypothetical protein